jgi:hypothetical protein
VAKPKPLTHKQCTKQLTKVQEALNSCRQRLREKLHSNWAELDISYRFNHYRRNYLRREAIGHAIAYLAALKTPLSNRDYYAVLDHAVGYKVYRKSKLTDNRARRITTPINGSIYLGWIAQLYGGMRGTWEPPVRATEKPKNLGFAGCKPFYPPEPKELSPVHAYLESKLELEYWQEMVRLAANRETQKAFELEFSQAS